MITFAGVIENMRQSGYTMWTLKKNKRQSSTVAVNWDPSVSMQESVQRLKSIISEQICDVLIIELLPPLPDKKNPDQKPKKSLEMEIDMRTINPQMVSGLTNQSTPNLSRLEEMVQQLNEKNAKLQADLIKAEYINKIAELEQKIEGPSNDPINKILELVIPIAAHYVQNMYKGSSTQVINGLDQFDAADPVTDLLQVDPDGMAVIAKIASIAVNDPKFYHKLKPLLFNIEKYKLALSML